MSFDSKISALEGRIKELNTSMNEMDQQEKMYEEMGMPNEAKHASEQSKGYYEEWLSATTELADLVKEMKRGK